LASFNGYAINLRFYTINMIIRTLTQMPKRVIGSCPKMRIGTG
ncbi:hypothetical protein D3OALGB2SA_4446, partial [Olavius algarvensis associated proteobacterium Delta 3]